MKKFKIVLSLLILAFLVLIAVQNQEYFMTKEGLIINLYFSKYSIPEIANGFYWIACFASGLLLSYFSSLFFRFKAQKQIKLQSQTIDNYRETVLELKKEIENIKASGYFNRENRPANYEDEDKEAKALSSEEYADLSSKKTSKED